MVFALTRAEGRDDRGDLCADDVLGKRRLVMLRWRRV